MDIDLEPRRFASAVASLSCEGKCWDPESSGRMVYHLDYLFSNNLFNHPGRFWPGLSGLARDEHHL